MTYNMHDKNYAFLGEIILISYFELYYTFSYF